MESLKINFRIPVAYRSYVTVVILFLINLLNYMDRYTIAAVLTDIQKYFDVGDVEAGLLQTVFVCSYMIFAPICGFLGDRYPRKLIMIVGIFIWSTAVLISSFIGPNNFWTFFVMRGIVGIGEASYSTVSPSIIADLFTKDQRSRMLMLFYFAIPVGSGLGFVVGSNLARYLGSWQWGIRLTPILGCCCLLLMIFVLQEPKRGAAEESHLKALSWWKDVMFLFKNKSFIWSTLGFVCVAFASGAISWWAPNFVIYSQSVNIPSGGTSTIMPPVVYSKNTINLIFGVVTCLGGFAGVTLGSFWATRWRRTNPKADALVCAVGLLLCMPFYFIAINIVEYTIQLSWVFMFCAVTCLCLNWAVLPDILMYIMIPPRRATANAIQMLVGHLFGDATSPYIIGQVSESILGNSTLDTKHFLALKYSLYIPAFILILGGCFFLVCSLYVEDDKRKTDLLIRGLEKEESSESSETTGLRRNESSDPLIGGDDPLA